VILLRRSFCKESNRMPLDSRRELRGHLLNRVLDYQTVS
jgi:hypothetical protein